MPAEPRGEGVGGAVGQQVDDPASLQVDQDGAEAAPLPAVIARPALFDDGRWAELLHNELPFEVHGYPTHFRPFEGSEAGHGRLGFMTPRNVRPIHHGVGVTTVRRFFWTWLRVDPLAELEPVEWVVMWGD